jgi:hypothetical protein
MVVEGGVVIFGTWTEQHFHIFIFFSMNMIKV